MEVKYETENKILWEVSGNLHNCTCYYLYCLPILTPEKQEKKFKCQIVL